jgi:hypothetical protein
MLKEIHSILWGENNTVVLSEQMQAPVQYELKLPTLNKI